jgi:hypothetical protein
VADTAHKVVCSQLDCHGPPTCNPSTGNCDSAPISGTSCGGNLCNAPGTCTAGVCSGTSLKDCSAGVPVCSVGYCDVSTGACSAENALNDTPCPSGNKCLSDTRCSGGVCVGAEMPCDPSGPCVTAACDPATGACRESPGPDGTPCASDVCPIGECRSGACGCGAADDAGAPDLASATPHPGCGAGGTPRSSPRTLLYLLAAVLARRCLRRWGRSHA